MNDNKSLEKADHNFYYEFQIKSRGVCVTEIDSAEALREMIQEDLTAMYGAEGFSIVEIREATAEEVTEAFRNRQLFEEMTAEAEPAVDPVTVN